MLANVYNRCLIEMISCNSKHLELSKSRKAQVLLIPLTTTLLCRSLPVCHSIAAACKYPTSLVVTFKNVFYKELTLSKLCEVELLANT